MGMNEQQLQRLFIPYSQAHTSSSQYMGTGLGLVIAKVLLFFFLLPLLFPLALNFVFLFL